MLSLKEIEGVSETLPDVMHLPEEAPIRSSKISALPGKEDLGRRVLILIFSLVTL